MPFDADRFEDLGGDAVVQVRLLFEVERFLVPSEAMSGSRQQVWRHVDELRVAPATSAFLASNGFRIGVMPLARYEELRILLDELGARSERASHPVTQGVPLTLDLGALGDRETVFIIKPDGQLVGKTFENATRLLHVDYDVLPGGEALTALRVTPEIFKESVHPYWRIRDGDVGYHKDYQGMLYRDFAVQIATGRDEVLVIGTREGDHNPLTLGGKMLSETIEGRRWESILCVRPSLYRDGKLDTGGAE